MNKEKLKKKFSEGNRRAFNIVYDNYCDAMFAICLRYTKNKDEASDILQDAFIKVFEKCETYKPEYEIGGWIKRIVINTAINYLRKNKRFDLTDNFDSFENIEEVKDFEIENTNGLYEKLLEILKDLPTGYQTVFNLYVFENLSHKEIADYMNISINTSKSQLFKSRKMISKILSEKNIIKK